MIWLALGGAAWLLLMVFLVGLMQAADEDRDPVERLETLVELEDLWRRS